MPTYDYVCEACGHRFERWQTMSEKKLTTCPECGKKRLVRLVGAGAGVIFRGSGFYETDYKRKSTSRPAPSGSTSGSGSSSSTGSKEGPSPSDSSGPTGKSKGGGKGSGGS